MVRLEKVFTGCDAAALQSSAFPRLKGDYVFLIEREGSRGGFAFGIHSRPFIYICLWFDIGIYKFWKLVVGRTKDKFEWHFIRKRRVKTLNGCHIYFETDNGRCTSVFCRGRYEELAQTEEQCAKELSASPELQGKFTSISMFHC